MKMKKLGLLFMMLCMVFAVNAQELKKGDKFWFSSKICGIWDVSSAELKGKVVLVSLFATWCGPCQLELADIEKTLWPEYKDNKDFVLLVIGREHTDEQLRLIMNGRNSLSRYIPILNVRCSLYLLKSQFLAPIFSIKKEKPFILPSGMRKKNLDIWWMPLRKHWNRTLLIFQDD